MHKEDIFLGLWMLRMNIWMFHKTGVPLNHPFIGRFSIVVNPPSLGTPMYGTPCIIYIYIYNVCVCSVLGLLLYIYKLSLSI